jgi:hypothetical protein
MFRPAICLIVAVTALLFVGSVVAEELMLEPTDHVLLKPSVASEPHGFALRFDLTSIPQDVHVDFARLLMTLNVDTVAGQSVAVVVSEAIQGWTSSGALSLNDVGKTGGMSEHSYVTSGEEQDVEVDVTEIVRAWHDGAVENNGVVVWLSPGVDRRCEAVEGGAGVKVTLEVFFAK